MASESDDVEVVRRTAALARIEVTGEEAARLGPQFARILEAFRAISELDVSGAEAVLRGGTATPRTRPDEPRPSLPADALLANAPERVEDFYSVPRTVGGEP